MISLFSSQRTRALVLGISVLVSSAFLHGQGAVVNSVSQSGSTASEGSEAKIQALPTIQTLQPVRGTNQVELKGTANPGGMPMDVFFEWGASDAFGNRTPATALPNVETNITFSERLFDLPLGEYFYRAVGVTTAETLHGATLRFSITSLAGRAALLAGNDFFRTSLSSDRMFTGEDLSFEFWFKTQSGGVLLGELDSADPALWDYALAEILPDKTLKIELPDVPEVVLGEIEFGKWHHLALVYNHKEQKLSGYLDGVLKGESTGERKSPKDTNRAAFYVFGRGGPTNLGPGNWLVGSYDEVRIWDIPLTPEEIAEGYDKRTRQAPPAMVVCWQFETVFGSTSENGGSISRNPAQYVPIESLFPRIISTSPLQQDLRPRLYTEPAVNLNALIVELQAYVHPEGKPQVSVNPEGTPAYLFFQYGLDGLTQSTPPQEILFSSVGRVEISSFSPGLVYQYRSIASNRFGVVYGPKQQIRKTGIGGYAVRFYTNMFGDYIRTVNSQKEYLPKDDVTIEFWCKPEREGVLVGEVDFNAPQQLDRSIIEILNSGTIQAAFEGVPLVTASGASWNDWNHVALRYNSTNQTMSLFLNGAKRAETTGDRISPAERTNVVSITFGKSTSVWFGTGQSYYGGMEEVRIWMVARTDEEILLNRNKILPGRQPGLVANWRFEELNMGRTHDFSGRGNVARNRGAERIISDVPLEYKFDPVRMISPSSAQLEFIGRADAFYQLERTLNFHSWTPIATNQAFHSGNLFFEVPIQENLELFRAVPK